MEFGECLRSAAVEGSGHGPGSVPFGRKRQGPGRALGPVVLVCPPGGAGVAGPCAGPRRGSCSHRSPVAARVGQAGPEALVLTADPAPSSPGRAGPRGPEEALSLRGVSSAQREHVWPSHGDRGRGAGTGVCGGAVGAATAPARTRSCRGRVTRGPGGVSSPCRRGPSERCVLGAQWRGAEGPRSCHSRRVWVGVGRGKTGPGLEGGLTGDAARAGGWRRGSGEMRTAEGRAGDSSGGRDGKGLAGESLSRRGGLVHSQQPQRRPEPAPSPGLPPGTLTTAPHPAPRWVPSGQGAARSRWLRAGPPVAPRVPFGASPDRRPG